MSDEGQQLPPPGWYPDPDGSDTQRWWDGQQWVAAPEPNPAGPGEPGMSSVPPTGGDGPITTSRPWWRKKRFAIPLGLLAVLVLVGVFGDGDAEEASEEDVAAEDTEPAEEPLSEPEPELTPEPEPIPDPEPEPEPTPEPEPEPTPEPAFTDAIEFDGQGDDIVALEVPEGEPAIATFTHDGESNFQVTAYDADVERLGGLVNEIGAYEGTRPLNFTDPPVGELEISADGAWTVTVEPLLEAREAEAQTEGSGDDVLLVLGVEATDVLASHDGDSNFQVTAWGDRRSSMVNEIGTYEGRVRLPRDTIALEVVADGSWSFDFD